MSDHNLYEEVKYLKMILEIAYPPKGRKFFKSSSTGFIEYLMVQTQAHIYGIISFTQRYHKQHNRDYSKIVSKFYVPNIGTNLR